MDPNAPADFNKDAVNPALLQSANPAADIASAAISRLFGGGAQQPAAPETSSPTPAAAPAPAAAPQVPVASPSPSPVAPQVPSAPPQQVPVEDKPLDLAARYSVPDPNAHPVVPTLPDVPPQQDIRLPENTAENVGHAFAAARSEAKKYKQMAEEFRQQVEKVRADYGTYAQREVALTEKLTAAQNQVHDLEERIGKMDLEQAPSFREKYDTPIQNVQAQLVKTLVDNGVSQQEADDQARRIVLAGSAEEVQQIVSELPPAVQGMAMYKFQEADGLFAQRSQALEEWRSTRTGLEQVQTREGAVVSAQRRNELVNSGLDVVSSVVPQNIWNDPDFAKYREGAVEKVKAWYGQASDDQIAAAAVEGALVAPFAYRTIQELCETIVSLQEKLGARSQLRNPPTEPYYRGVQPPPPPPPKPEDDKNKPWSKVDQATDPVSAAQGLVEGSLRKMM